MKDGYVKLLCRADTHGWVLYLRIPEKGVEVTIMGKQDIKSLTLEELTEAIRQMGDKPFRAKQDLPVAHQKSGGRF